MKATQRTLIKHPLELKPRHQPLRALIKAPVRRHRVLRLPLFLSFFPSSYLSTRRVCVRGGATFCPLSEAAAARAREKNNSIGPCQWKGEEAEGPTDVQDLLRTLGRWC